MTEANALHEIPDNQKSSFSSFLKTAASFTGDLSNLTCPSFLLAPVSLLEYSAFWADRPDLLVAISQSESEEERFYAAIKWFISALNGSFSSRVPKGEWEKKPFNPILGEQFRCHWNNGTRIVCEQVSHHPPVSGFYIENHEAGITVVGHDGQKTRFSGTQMIVEQIGYFTLKLAKTNETYLFTLPSLSVNGIWYAAPYVELDGKSFVQSSSGYHADITYTTKGWVSGVYHRFKALISHANLPGPTTVEGQWTEKSTIKKHKGKEEHFLDLKEKHPPIEKTVEKDGELYSRQVWKTVAEALVGGDFQKASSEKSLVENKQRADRKEREESGAVWEPKYFKKVEGNDIYGNLADEIKKKAGTSVNIGEKMGKGGWQFRGDTLPETQSSTTDHPVAMTG